MHERFMLLTPTLSRNIPLLKWSNFLGSLCFYAAVMFIYFVEITNSYALAASVFSITMLAAAVLEVPTGIFSDWFGRRGVLILGAACSLVSLGFFAFASGYWMLVIGAIMDGLAFALQSGNNDALLHDTLKELGREEEYAENQGAVGFWVQVALASAVLGGSFFVGISLALVFKISLVPFGAALLLALFIKEPSIKGNVKGNAFSHLKEALTLVSGNSRLRILAAAQALDAAIWRVKYPLLPAFFLTLWPLWAISIPRAMAHAASALGMRAAGFFNRRYAPQKVTLYSQGTAFGIGTFILALPTSLSPILHPFSVFFLGLSYVTQDAMLHKEYTDAYRATLSSLISFAGTLLGAALAFLIGLYADYAGLLPALLLLQTLFIPVIFMYWRLGRLQGTVDFVKKL